MILRSLVLEAQTAPIRFAERAAQVKRMLEGPSGRGKGNLIYHHVVEK